MQIGGIRLDMIARAMRTEARVDRVEAIRVEAGRVEAGRIALPAVRTPLPLPGAPAPDLLQPRPTVIAFPLRGAPQEMPQQAPAAHVTRAYDSGREGLASRDVRPLAQFAAAADAAETLVAGAAARSGRRAPDNDTAVQAAGPRAPSTAPAPWFAYLPEPLRRLVEPAAAERDGLARRSLARTAGAGAPRELEVEGGWKEAATFAAIVAMSVLGIWLLVG
jgi:hypothetical protein